MSSVLLLFSSFRVGAEEEAVSLVARRAAFAGAAHPPKPAGSKANGIEHVVNPRANAKSAESQLANGLDGTDSAGSASGDFNHPLAGPLYNLRTQCPETAGFLAARPV
jgi:hypothetical protein